MTCIAYRDGVISADSRVWVNSEDGGARFYEHSPKLFRVGYGKDEVIIATAGASDPGNRFIDWWRNGRPATDEKIKGGTMLVLKRSVGQASIELWEYDESWTGERMYEPYYAIGTGTKLALGAFVMGATAKQAVEAACKHDPYCGGKVHAWRLGDDQQLKWE